MSKQKPQIVPKIEWARMPMNSPSTTLELGEVGENESGRFRGLAVRFNSPIETFPTRTMFRKGAFAKTISERGPRVKVLFGHNTSNIPIGVPTELMESNTGLEVAVSLNTSVDAINTANMLRHLKTLNKLSAAELSVGFDALNFEMFEDPDTREIFRVVTEARLWEISVVAFGADPTTEVKEAANMKVASGSSPQEGDGRPDLDEALDTIVTACNVSRETSAGPDETQEGRTLSDASLAKVRSAVKALQALIDIVESKAAKHKDKADKSKEKQSDDGMHEDLAIDAALAEIEIAEALAES